MDLSKINETLRNQHPWRLKQIQAAIFKQLIDSWSQAINLPQSLRSDLTQNCSLEISYKLFEAKNRQAIKALITLKDQKKIETVLIRHKNRNTVCVSSQVGCPIGCIFCATGAMGFSRNLAIDEIIEQVLLFARLLKKEGKRVDNVVFMGMGEPFLNYDNVIAAARILNDAQGLNIGARHISISTIGISAGIEKLIDEPLQLNLAVSLHAPNDRLRQKIIPAAKNYPLEKIIKIVRRYLQNTNRRVMFEYIMIDNVNDSDKCAYELAALIKNNLSSKLVFVNLIRYNPARNFKPSNEQQIKRFKTILEDSNIETTQRFRFGQDIKAACGQLAAD